jgi:cobyrinic acid a,c-diamide synthase
MSASTEEQGSSRGLIIAAPRSRSGKTIITTGLMRACCNRGLSVAGAKCGPDYIDGAFHAAATGRPSLNLDSWAMDPALLQALAATAARGCDLLLCEGVMGLFDGAPAEEGRTGSTADVAAALGLPVLLVLDVRAQSQTAAAIVKGCASYDPRIELAGVILNCVASERHARLAAEAVEKLGIPVLGALPRDETLSFPERHLGLVQAMENEKLDNLLDAIAAAIDRHIHVDSIAAAAGTLALEPAGERRARRSCSFPRSPVSRRPRLAIFAGFREATPSCTPGGLRQHRAFLRGCAGSRRPGPFMANVAAIWCWARH